MFTNDVTYLVLVLESSEDALVLPQSPTTEEQIHLKYKKNISESKGQL